VQLKLALSLALWVHVKDSLMKRDNEPYRQIKIRPIAGGLGAEVSGVDLSAPLSDAVRARILIQLSS